MIATAILNARLFIFSCRSIRRLGKFAAASRGLPVLAAAAMRSRRAVYVISITCLACVLLFLGSGPAPAQAPEDQIKADMLYYFSLFIEWPEFADGPSPFVFCLLGEDNLKPWLQDHLRVGIHPVEIRQLESVEQASACHLLYIGRSEQPPLQQILSRLRGTSVLTVSDIPDFCSQGGMIGLLRQDNQMRFDLNAEAAEAAGLKIDSALKRIARNVDCGKRQ